MKNKVILAELSQAPELKSNVMPLFVAQGFNRVKVGGFLCRIPSEEDSCQRTYGEGEQYTPRLDEDRPVCHGFDDKTGSASQYDAYQSSRDAD